jgi:hypothetical protein
VSPPIIESGMDLGTLNTDEHQVSWKQQKETSRKDVISAGLNNQLFKEKYLHSKEHM